jgi:hypothetical protein
MSLLLTAPPRRTTRVDLKSRPDIEVYILTLNCIEFLEMGAAMREKSGAKELFSVEVEHALCDASGALLLKPGEGETFARTISVADWDRLRKCMSVSNALTDEAVEQTEKN